MSPEEFQKKYHHFIKWYAMPKELRKPLTNEEFCQEIGIEMSTLSEFTELDTYTDDLYDASIKWGKTKIPELLHHLYTQYVATKNPAHLRMYKELINIDKSPDQKNRMKEKSKGTLRELFQMAEN